MKITKIFWITLGIMTVLFILPFILTYNAPSYNEARILGFPLAAYSYGGWCATNNSCPGFILFNFIIDLVIIGAVSFGFDTMYRKLIHDKKSKV